MTEHRWGWALVLAGLACAGRAQALPTPKEFYFDEDKRAVPIVVVAGEGEAQVAALLRERERGRRGLEAAAQLAHLAYAQGRADLGKALYEQALTSTRADRAVGRGISWNYGWDLYRSADYAGALAQWSQLAETSLGGPAWMPSTLALVLWRLDRKAEALAWYAAAVRTEPLLWGDPRQLPALLPDWRAEDRAQLAEVQAAWAAHPPAWP